MTAAELGEDDADYEDDEDFVSGLKDECWIIIDVDPKPLFEREREQRDQYQIFTEVEMP